VGFRFRRSVRVLPGIRLNLSKSGASVSLGGRGLHYTVGPNGTRTTVGLPGTGLSWTQYAPHHGSDYSNRSVQRDSPASYISSPAARLSQPLTPIEAEPALRTIESTAGDEINALSTSQLAPTLNKAHRRFRLAIPTLIGCLCLFVFAIGSGVQELVGLSALYFSVVLPISIFLDRYRRSIRISLKLNKTAQTVAAVLSESFSDLMSCDAIWSVRAEAHTNDWKRNAGATTLNQRDRIRIQIARPTCIRGNVAFPAIKLGSAEIFFLPDSILVVSKNSVAALHYRDLEFSCSTTIFIEGGRVPRDAAVVGQTWRFVNKNGGPDRRFNSNKQLPKCQYGEMNFSSRGGLNGKMQFSNIYSGQKFEQAIRILIKNAMSSELNPIASYSDAKYWPSAVFLCCALLIGAALASVGVLAKQGPLFDAQTQSETKKSDVVNVTKDSVANAPGNTRVKTQGGARSAMPPLNISPGSFGSTSASPPTRTYGSSPPQRVPVR
jgi:hypothetical protein